MLADGDKVEVLDYPVKRHIGKKGTVIAVYKRLTEKLPDVKRTKEAHYRLLMNDGTQIQHLREQQLRKL